MSDAGPMPRCELCDLELDQCPHGRQQQLRASAHVALVLISPRGVAHLAGCPHKGDDLDYSQWGEADAPGSWASLGQGGTLVATGGGRPGLIAKKRCADCLNHGVWE